jgi:YggT family protein
VFAQIGLFLVDAVVSFFVFLLLARFHFQWLRVPFRNPAGEFVLATTSWLVVPVRRVVPGFAGLDLPTLLLAYLLQALGLWAQAAIVGAEPAVLTIAVIALIDMVRYSLYILIFAVIVQAVLSWVNPYTPLAPVFDALTRPFLRPLRRLVPPVGGVDLTSLILLLVLYVLLIVVNQLAPRIAAASF